MIPRGALTVKFTLFDAVLTGMELLEDDYLGGSGSRGSGKIAFRDLQDDHSNPARHYEDPQSVPVATLVDGDGVAALREADYQSQILEAIQA